MEDKHDQQPPVITIDGPSGSGKGTIALKLAQKLGWHFLDSGALYRAMAWGVLHYQVSIADSNALEKLLSELKIELCDSTSEGLTRVLCDGVDVTDTIRTENCAEMASKIGAIPEVRAALLQRQRDMRKFPGLVTDGRDMGTVVFPNATLKFYFQAEVEERAKRRYEQLKKKGVNVSLRQVFEELKSRDMRDEQRTIAPAQSAPDMILIDTTNTSVDEVLGRVLTDVQEHLKLGS